MIPEKNNCILTINGGSSSIKFSLYKLEEPLHLILSGVADSINTDHTILNFSINDTGEKGSIDIEKSDLDNVMHLLSDWLQKQHGFDAVIAIGHRIVYGMAYTKPERITPQLLDELQKVGSYDPEHMPGEIQLIKICTERFPSVVQFACFDTAFHATMPQMASMLAIPRRYHEKGIKRYGFHGLSYSFLIEELQRIAGKEIAMGKVIIAHLGNGASLAAIKEGKSIDTSMGFTPASGIPMSTRSGDLDPGVAWFLMQEEKITADTFNHMINHESGLLGISETSSDMRDLMKRQHTDIRAAEAIGLFCYQVKKWIGSFAASLGGIDAVIFAGGIGEHVAEIRASICDGLAFLGIRIDDAKNAGNEIIISQDTSSTKVFVIPTNEELMIARLVKSILN